MSQETSQHPSGSDKYTIDRQPNLLSSDSAGQAPYGNPQDPSRFGDRGLAEQPNNSHNGTRDTAGGSVNLGSEESPDLLRWRADSLLDEMMLGGADGSATQHGATSPSSASYQNPGHPNAGYQAQDYQTGASFNAGHATPLNGSDPYDYGEGPAHDGSPYPQQPSSFHQSFHQESATPEASPESSQPNYQEPYAADLGGGPTAPGSSSNYGPPSQSSVEQQAPVTSSGTTLAEPLPANTQPPSDLQPPDLQPPGVTSPGLTSSDGYSAANNLIGDNPNNGSGYGQNRNPQNRPAQNSTGPNQLGPNQPGANSPEQYGPDHQSGLHQSGNQSIPNQQPLPGQLSQPGQGPAPQGAPSFGQDGHYPPNQGNPPQPSNLRQPTAAQHYPPSMAPSQSNGEYAATGPGNLQNYEYPPTPGYGQRPEQPQQPYPQQPYSEQSYAQNPADWANRPSFEQGESQRLDMGYSQPDLGQRGYPSSRGPGSVPGQERNQQPLDPATYYAQQIAWRREQERKQWAISSGSSSDYLTSVPRYEEAQNRTASYNAARQGAPASWQQQEPYQSGYDPRYPQSGGYQPQNHQQPANSYSPDSIHANPAYSPQLGPVNPGYGPGQQPSSMPFAERMDVGAQAQRRSNLLPRRTQMSVDALYEEMTVLQSQVDMALPIYGDSADRAMHLLEKGRGILEQHPERSAEVAYYVQQVSGIIQRGQQRLEWSNTYRSRLSRYLTAWLVLGCLGVIGSYAYGDLIVDAFSSWFPAATRFFSAHLTSIFLVFAASILGSALAALINMWRHGQKEYGFFDRKYGLLGVLLPLMGLVVGLVIYFVAAIIYLFLNISPNSNWIAQTLPALLALIYGFNQENIYGTSE